jgi:hypothetical protein
MSDREPKFQVGDLVRHRASGTPVVISQVHTGCKLHGSGTASCSVNCGSGAFIGSYTLHREFGDSFSCDELLLELAEIDSPEPSPKPEPPKIEVLREDQTRVEEAGPRQHLLSADDCQRILNEVTCTIVRHAISVEQLLPWIRLAGNMQDRGIHARTASGLLNNVISGSPRHRAREIKSEYPKPEPPENDVLREDQTKVAKPEPPPNRDTTQGKVPEPPPNRETREGDVPPPADFDPYRIPKGK